MACRQSGGQGSPREGIGEIGQDQFGAVHRTIVFATDIRKSPAEMLSVCGGKNALHATQHLTHTSACARTYINIGETGQGSQGQVPLIRKNDINNEP